MSQNLTPLAGLYEPYEITEMAALLDEICEDVAPSGLFASIPKSEIRMTVGKLIIETQSRQRLRPSELRTAVVTRLEAQARRQR